MVDEMVMRRKRVWTRKPEFTSFRVHAPAHVNVRWALCVYPARGSTSGLVEMAVRGGVVRVQRA